jgi:hypothetical protein
MRLTFKLVDWAKKIGFHDACGSHEASKGMNRKGLTLHWMRDFFLTDGLRTGTLAFFMFSDSNWNVGSSWVSRLILDWNQTRGSSHSSVCWLTLQIVGLVSLRNSMNQSFLWGQWGEKGLETERQRQRERVLFLWKTLIQTHCPLTDEWINKMQYNYSVEIIQP